MKTDWKCHVWNGMVYFQTKLLALQIIYICACLLQYSYKNSLNVQSIFKDRFINKYHRILQQTGTILYNLWCIFKQNILLCKYMYTRLLYPHICRFVWWINISQACDMCSQVTTGKYLLRQFSSNVMKLRYFSNISSFWCFIFILNCNW